MWCLRSKPQFSCPSYSFGPVNTISLIMRYNAGINKQKRRGVSLSPLSLFSHEDQWKERQLSGRGGAHDRKLWNVSLSDHRGSFQAQSRPSSLANVPFSILTRSSFPIFMITVFIYYSILNKSCILPANREKTENIQAKCLPRTVPLVHFTDFLKSRFEFQKGNRFNSFYVLLGNLI